MALTVDELRKAIEGLDGNLPVFFERPAPDFGNIVSAGSVRHDTFVLFGLSSPCVIIGEFANEDEDGYRNDDEVDGDDSVAA
jgi:hypothetical protein